jgi:hypothetical protein
MKHTLKFILLIFAVNTGICKLNAQTDVTILDLSVFPESSISTISSTNFLPTNNSKEANEDSVKLVVSFKIGNADKASKAHFLLGKTKDNGDVFSAQPVFNSGGKNGIVLKNKEAFFYIQLSKVQYSSYNVITLYVETISGTKSNRLYSEKRGT